MRRDFGNGLLAIFVRTRNVVLNNENEVYIVSTVVVVIVLLDIREIGYLQHCIIMLENGG